MSETMIQGGTSNDALAYGIVDEMLKFSGRQFDPQVVQALIRVLQKQGQGVIVNSARHVEARDEIPHKQKPGPEKIRQMQSARGQTKTERSRVTNRQPQYRIGPIR